MYVKLRVAWFQDFYVNLYCQDKEQEQGENFHEVNTFSVK